MLLFAAAAFGQKPSITSAGVVNAASWSSPIAPGELVAIFGTNLATAQASANPPYPNTLGGTSVTINGIAAPVVFVSSTQVNVQAPASLTAQGFDIGSAPVVVKTDAGASSAEVVGVANGAPGVFTAQASGCGQAAALNIKPDGTVSVNSSSNSAAPGDYIALFGTGFGMAEQQPADGFAATAASTLRTSATLFLDGAAVPSLTYGGLAPGLAGVDQINFQVPSQTRNGCSVPVIASQTLSSPATTISVEKARGQCVDPAVQSWGQIFLARSIFSGPGAVNETFSASFPTAPVPPVVPVEAVVYGPAWSVGNSALSGRFLLSAVPINQRTCSVPGYSNLSAGTIQIQPPSGPALEFQPMPVPGGGVIYNGSLPFGFLGPGVYSISGTGGGDVSLNARVTVGAPIQIQTSLAPATAISNSQPLNIKWTGGTPGTLVRVALYSGNQFDYSYADAGAGSITILPKCSGQPASCGFGLPTGSDARISIAVQPAGSTIVSAPGITGSVQLNWRYYYEFPGLILTE